MKKLNIYKSTLSEVYGLTPSMIQELGEPDRYCDNPNYKCGPPASLYLVERVEAWIEQNRERVEKARLTRTKRSEAMRALHARKRAERWEKAKEWVASVAITVETPFPETFLDHARRFNKFTAAKGLRSYVRHQLTNYETLLRQVNDEEFSGDLYPLLRERVDAAVANALDSWEATLDRDDPDIIECLRKAAVLEDPVSATWEEYLARYDFHGPVAEAMAKGLQDPRQAHPGWFRVAKVAMEKAVAAGRVTDLSGLNYECIREAIMVERANSGFHQELVLG